MVKIIIANDYEEMSQISAQIVLAKMYVDRRVNLSLTAGNTPKRMFEILRRFIPNRSYLDNVFYYNFDEVGLCNERHGFTMRELNKQFYDPCKIKRANICELTSENYHDYDQKICADGGLDLVVMGIGEDGHFCGNMPDITAFENETYLLPVKEDDAKFQMLENLIGIKPTGKVVTFGPKTVMSAKHLLLFANGKHKAKIIKLALEGPVTTKVPASILKLHPNLIVVLDKEAAAKLEVK